MGGSTTILFADLTVLATPQHFCTYFALPRLFWPGLLRLPDLCTISVVKQYRIIVLWEVI
jgi:hypothetical protein